MLTVDSKRRRHHARMHSALLLIAMAALLSYCGWIVAAWDGVSWTPKMRQVAKVEPCP